MGRQLEYNMGGNVQKAVFFCTAGKMAIYHKDCFRGMVMTVVNGNTDPEQGFLFCKLVPIEFKSDCYDGVGRWVTMLHPTKEGKTIECLRAENAEYSKICMDASLESLKFL